MNNKYQILNTNKKGGKTIPTAKGMSAVAKMAVPGSRTTWRERKHGGLFG